jgi:hypothetical protein
VRATKDSDRLVPDREANDLILRFLERIEARHFNDDEP